MRSVFSRLFLLLAALVIAASVLPAFAEEEAQAPSEPAPAAEAPGHNDSVQSRKHLFRIFFSYLLRIDPPDVHMDVM